MANLDLRNMDCMELMAQYPDKHFDLAIVDPPYGIGMDGSELSRRKNGTQARKFYTEKGWDSAIPSDAYFDELIRVSKNQIVWGGNYFSLALSRCWIFWYKMQNDLTMSDGELAWTSFNRPARQFSLHRSALWAEGTIHPTQKPVALYKWLLHNYAKQGDKILDTHLGSGSIAIACHQMGFDLTGSELDKDYFEAMQKRIKYETAQEDLFITA